MVWYGPCSATQYGNPRVRGNGSGEPCCIQHLLDAWGCGGNDTRLMSAPSLAWLNVAYTRNKVAPTQIRELTKAKPVSCPRRLALFVPKTYNLLLPSQSATGDGFGSIRRIIMGRGVQIR